MPYPADAESSVVSDWKLHYWNLDGPGVPVARGLRTRQPQDMRFMLPTAPGVCVLAQRDDLPTMPKHNPAVEDKERNIAQCAAQLRELGVYDARPQWAINLDRTKEARAAKHYGGPARRAASEASLSSSHTRRNSLPAVEARARYVTSGERASPARRMRTYSKFGTVSPAAGARAGSSVAF